MSIQNQQIFILIIIQNILSLVMKNALLVNMEEMGMKIGVIHAGHANMFLSPVFRDTLAGVTGATIELFDTDGAAGAARGAGIGAGIYRDNNEAFSSLKRLAVVEPTDCEAYGEAYSHWKEELKKI